MVLACVKERENPSRSEYRNRDWCLSNLENEEKMYLLFDSSLQKFVPVPKRPLSIHSDIHACGM